MIATPPLQQAFDGLYPAGLQWYWRSDFCTEISDAAIAVHEKDGALLPTGHSDPANAERIAAWTKAYWADLHPTAASGTYVKFLMHEGPDRVREGYGTNHPRLAAIKRRYDPDNVFHVNQNIVPEAMP